MKGSLLSLFDGAVPVPQRTDEVGKTLQPADGNESRPPYLGNAFQTLAVRVLDDLDMPSYPVEVTILNI